MLSCSLNMAATKLIQRTSGILKSSTISSYSFSTTFVTDAKALPKRPPSSFAIYLSENYAGVKSKNPDFKITDVSKILAQSWKNIDASEKEKYENKSAVEKAKYEKTLAAIPREELDKLREEKRKKSAAKERRKDYKEKLSLGMPKRPSSPFLSFAAVMRTKEGNISSMKDFMTSAGAYWGRMSEAEKQPYHDRYAADKLQYTADMEAWQREMKSEGRSDLMESKQKTGSKGKKASKEVPRKSAHAA